MSTSDTKNSLVHDFVDVQARIDLTPLGEILAACRISVFEHIARLESDVHAWRSADTSISRLVLFLLVPTGDDTLVDPALDGYTRFDGTRAVHLWNSRGVLSGVAMLLERRNGPRHPRDIDDNECRV